MNPPAGAPVEMVVDPTWQWAFGSLHFGLAALTVFLAARGPVRNRHWAELRFRMHVLFGGALGALFFEGAIDRGGQLWYADIGAWHLTTLYGVSVPLWVMPVYLWFLGGGALVIIQRIRAGGRPKDFILIFAGITVADFALEIPLIKMAGLYRYWGDTQPFFHHDWCPLPLWYVTTNRWFDLLPAMIILLLMSTRIRHIEWSIPVVMVASCYITYGSVTWPVIASLQNNWSETVTWIAGGVTMVLGLGATYLGAQMAPRLQHCMDWYGKEKGISIAAAVEGPAESGASPVPAPARA
jgi:hypothetical protein